MNSGEIKKRVLIVDDETNVREALRMILSRVYDVLVAENGEQALSILEEKSSEAGNIFPDLVLLDVMMPGIDGITLLGKIKADYPTLPVIMLTASSVVKTAVQAMRIGAVDYLNKPYDVDELLSLIEDVFANKPTDSGSIRRAELSRSGLPEIEGNFGCMVGHHPLMEELYQKVSQLAVRNTTILITGESGTGKELIAREIHLRSPRAKGPFIALNCAAIPESLIESELFGHEKGAFTHAVDKRIGHFELADKGTLFLDEIGELSLPVQVKMLRFLQEQEFYRVGKSKPIQVDVRILAATNKSLETAVKEGGFRQDLFYRINVVTLTMPPLRERKEDIALLVEFFIKRLSGLYGNRSLQLSEEAKAALLNYSWPGNVRELENVIESVLALSKNEILHANDLPTRIRQASPTDDLKKEVLDGNIPFEEAERAFETEIILRALQKTNYIQTRAAELLGMSRRILKYKMDKLGISDPPREFRETRELKEKRESRDQADPK